MVTVNLLLNVTFKNSYNKSPFANILICNTDV